MVIKGSMILMMAARVEPSISMPRKRVTMDTVVEKKAIAIIGHHADGQKSKLKLLLSVPTSRKASDENIQI